MWMRTTCGLFSLVLAAGTAMAQNRVVDWESAQVHPLELTPDGSRLLAVNTADQRLEVFSVAAADGGLTPLASIPVGIEPVSVRARGNAEAWVVNALSDNISVVDLTTLRVTRSVDVGDEPGDVVFAGNPQRAFVSIAEANQVKRYDPADLGAAPTVVALQGRRPRALALAPDGSRVYVAFFESGNATSVVDIPAVSNPAGPYAGQNPPPNSGAAFDPPQLPANGAAPRVAQIVRRTAAGQWLDGNNRNWSNLIAWGVGSKNAVRPSSCCAAVSMREIVASKRLSTYRREPLAFKARPVGPWPTLMRAERAPEASVTMTLFEPMPETKARPSAGCQTMPRGSPSDCSRTSCGTRRTV